jgi:hypothetical protein
MSAFVGLSVDAALTNAAASSREEDGSMSIRGLGGWRPASNAFNLNKWLSYQGAAAQQDSSLNNAANNAFATAQSNYIQNMANLSANAALKRVEAQSKAAAAQLQGLINSIGSNVNTVA